MGACDILVKKSCDQSDWLIQNCYQPASSRVTEPASLTWTCGKCFKKFFVAVFLGCTSTGRVGLCFLWFYVQELPKAQPAVVLVLKRLRRRGNGLKSHPTDWEKPGIEPATPGLQDIGLSPTPRRLLKF